jgi:hypothetical protein
MINKPMSDEQLFKNGLPQWRVLKEFLMREGPLTKAQVTKILQLGIASFKLEPNLV